MLNQNSWISFGPLKYCSFDYRPNFNSWETNYSLGKLSLRIARHQLAIWWDFKVILNLLGRNFPGEKCPV